jgi:phosphate starvation-inducible protein PhoH and related proteins
LSKRRNRAEVMLLNSEVDTRFTSNNAIRFDSYQKTTRSPKATTPRQIPLIPKSLSQETYIDLLTNPEKLIIFATGPAGTGKTMLAVLAALRALRDGSAEKIIVTRPAIGVDDEQHGFLPGDLNEKMAPWTRPIFDIIGEHYRQQDIVRMLDEGIIEISPLAYMRGRSFKNAWIIADEMQNGSISQLKMLLTRFGHNSKMIVTGDLNQTDKQFKETNGLLDFITRLENSQSETISMVRFGTRDVQRHAVVSEVLKLYGDE